MTKQEIDNTEGLTEVQRLALYSQYGITDEDEDTKNIKPDETKEPETYDEKKTTFDDIPNGDEEDLLAHKKTQTRGDGQNSDQGGNKFDEKEFDKADQIKDFTKEEMFEIAESIVALFTLGIVVVCRYVSLGTMPESLCKPSASSEKAVTLMLAKVLYKYQYKFPIVFALIFMVFVVYSPPIYEATKYRKVEQFERKRKRGDGKKREPENEKESAQKKEHKDDFKSTNSAYKKPGKEDRVKPKKNAVLSLDAAVGKE